MRRQLGKKQSMGMAGKTISAERDRVQSDLLAGTIGTVLVAKTALVVSAMHAVGPYPRWFWFSVAFSVAFALLVRLLRSATTPAAILGAFVSLNTLLAQSFGMSWRETMLPALLSLFLLTFAATRFGRKRKEQMGTAEERRGRRASQIIANLGIAGIFAGGGSPFLIAACLAALAEATADTVSSEMGQALGGKTLLITNWSEVPAGTDGGISVAGTTLGAIAAGVIVLVTAGLGFISAELGMTAFVAAVAGLIFDSVLGATLERRGWMGNDLVNFSSTLFAAILAFAGMLLLGQLRP